MAGSLLWELAGADLTAIGGGAGSLHREAGGAALTVTLATGASGLLAEPVGAKGGWWEILLACGWAGVVVSKDVDEVDGLEVFLSSASSSSSSCSSPLSGSSSVGPRIFSTRGERCYYSFARPSKKKTSREVFILLVAGSQI